MFFNGVVAKKLCGCGMYLRINDHSSHHIWLGVGVGTNFRALLLALWGNLYFSLKHNFLKIHIFGDSKVIVDWAKSCGNLQVAEMEQWINRVRIIIYMFLCYLFCSYI